ncbi:MAG: hypothetical protein WA160_02815 [Pseudobdellovibrio sp.]
MLKKVFCFFVLALVSCNSSPTKTDLVLGGPEQGFLPPPVWKSSMQNLKKDLITLQPYFFDKVKFNDPKNKLFLEKEIHSLAQESLNIKHDPMISSQDPSVRFISIQFADELTRADENFSTGHLEFSRSQLVKVTSYCVECHTRLKQGPDFNSQTSTTGYLDKLPVVEQIEFMIAFRQFDSAFDLVLKTMKKSLPKNSIDYDSNRIARLGLLIAVQFKQDGANAQKLTAAIEMNSSLPSLLRKKNKLWIKSLASWGSNDTLRTLPEIRNLIKNRKSEVEDMRVIAALLQILTTELNTDELGEALLLTGESYESINKISIMSLHENYYESCVRKAPKSKFAKICFDKLNDSIRTSYSGTSGTQVPTDIQKNLQNLKKELN